MFLRLAVLILALGGALALPAMNIGNDTLTRGRYAGLRAYMASGEKNVRWETRPMSFSDASGKSMDTKSATGMVFKCLDVAGKERGNGEEYERPNGKFKYRCNNGNEEVIACVGSNRTNRAVIPVGQTLDLNGFWHKCESYENGSVIYTQQSSCRHSGKDYRPGEEVNVGFLRLQCQDDGYKVVGCFYLDDTNQVVSMNPGDKREAGKVTHFCEEHGDSLQYFAKASGCTKNGKDYKEGDTFSQNHLHYKCINGLVDIIGCYTEEGKDLPIGKDVVENGVAHRCYRNSGAVEYTEFQCGSQGTPSCSFEPIPESPDDAPTLARGLKAPGFGTFAVVQRVGENGFATDPNSMKLELDKLLMSHGRK